MREFDPLATARAGEQSAAALSEPDAQRMRRAIVAAASEPRVRTAFWPQPLAVAATIALTMAASVAVGRHIQPRALGGEPAGASTNQIAALKDVRQLQFATPGGTRVIWVFNQDFQP
jgi:hypothetical protein